MDLEPCYTQSGFTYVSQSCMSWFDNFKAHRYSCSHWLAGPDSRSEGSNRSDVCTNLGTSDPIQYQPLIQYQYKLFRVISRRICSEILILLPLSPMFSNAGNTQPNISGRSHTDLETDGNRVWICHHNIKSLINGSVRRTLIVAWKRPKLDGAPDRKGR